MENMNEQAFYNLMENLKNYEFRIVDYAYCDDDKLEKIEVYNKNSYDTNVIVKYCLWNTEKDYSPVRIPLLTEKDFKTEEDLKLAKYLVRFLWDSDNGITTYVEKDILLEDMGELYTNEFVEQFIKTYKFNDVLDICDDDSICILGDYLGQFNLLKFNY